MGKLVVTEFVSIDGVFEDPGGAEGYEHGGWTFEYNRGDDGDKFKMDELTESQFQLLGRRTYESFAKAWGKIRNFAREAGKDPDAVLNAAQLPIMVGKSRAAVKSAMIAQK